MNYCPTCGKPLPGDARFCAECGASTAPVGQPSARQELAQASLEVQSFNAALVVGRIVRLAGGLALWWFVAGPMFGETQPFLVIAAFFVLAGVGILAGQWVTLLLLRR